jgi:DNA-binding Lrp family transcriptional regulator
MLSISGDWDYLLRILVADVDDYNRFLMRIVLRHPSVASGSSHFALAQVNPCTASTAWSSSGAKGRTDL